MLILSVASSVQQPIQVCSVWITPTGLSFIVAFLALGLSLYNTWSQRKRSKLDIKFSDFEFYLVTTDGIYAIFRFAFVNGSTEPITISKITVHCDDHNICFGRDRKYLGETATHTADGVRNRKQWYSDRVPFTVPPLGCQIGAFHSDARINPVGRTCTVTLTTNKGDTVETVNIPTDGYKQLNDFLASAPHSTLQVYN